MQHAILTLIRHAETTGNLNRLLQGITDSPVTVFGQSQIDALARTWATTLQNDGNESSSRLNLPPPTLIVCSPIGRARKTAEAVHRACNSAPHSNAGVLEHVLTDRSTTRSHTAAERHNQEALALIVDPGLAEKDFGWKESTRGGVHITGYPKGHGAGESRSEFLQRVQRVGAEWLNAASSLASSDSIADKAAKVPHIVLVSHGMWISTFLSAHPPTCITQVSGQPGFLPFAANTGMFCLKVQPSVEAVKGETKPITELFRANDTRHLANVKRQKGGIGRGAFDAKQLKLSSFFGHQQARNTDSVDSKDDASIEGSPTKKRKM
ncbi:uncharacterized protein UTRI_04889 [Ustilago trichophora]|uniref:Phosphoglycerate mutase-like protein n=1 Tax=Ustilago trichophora TaxID=86804 RepID=A0A5C3EDD0_9BASI|nr:uncharacterized protein UTRI_04889 [Ustilago trichophora]